MKKKIYWLFFGGQAGAFGDVCKRSDIIIKSDFKKNFDSLPKINSFGTRAEAEEVRIQIIQTMLRHQYKGERNEKE